MVSQETLQFLQQHWDEDPSQLLFAQQRYPLVDMAFVAQQIEGRRQALEKYPTLAECPDFVYPPRLNREQSSSEATARYKSALVGDGTLSDLTGGMGVDLIFAAERCEKAVYIEQNEMLCENMRHNSKALQLNNVECQCGDSMAWIESSNLNFDTLFIDPARRDGQGRRVTAFEDCTPDITKNLAMLLSRCKKLVVKASPMISIDAAVAQLQSVDEVHIVAVKGECKEVVFVCSRDSGNRPSIICADICANKTLVERFEYGEEAAAEPMYCSELHKYLYEPNATLMKSGYFASLGNRYGLEMLGRNTHLYSAEQRVEGFPGRVFEILERLSLNAKSVMKAVPERKAHVVCRNYKISASALQQQLRIKEGGDLFIIATTFQQKPIGLLCRRV